MPKYALCIMLKSLDIFHWPLILQFYVSLLKNFNSTTAKIPSKGRLLSVVKRASQPSLCLHA